MGVSYSQALTNQAQAWTLILRIDGVGHWLSGANLSATDGTGRSCFTFRIPDYADSSLAIWRDDMCEPLPEQLSERGDPLGGVGELGSLTFALLDFDDYLGGKLAVDASPETFLSANITAAATSFDVDDASGLDATTVIYVGGEAMRVTGVSTNTLTVSRGYLGTTAASHDIGDRVYLQTPFIRGRRAELYRVPVDATSQSEETLIGSYVIDDGPRWVLDDIEDMSGKWHFGARSQTFVNRLAPPNPHQAEVTSVVDEGRGGLGFSAVDGDSAFFGWQIWTGSQADVAGFYVKVDGEIMTVRAESVAQGVVVDRREVLGSKRAELKPGMVGTRVFVAEIEGPCSFRYSPPTAATSRGSANWTKTAHWLDLIAILLTSSAHEDDGLELVNFPSGGTNYSCLPPGYGVGVPESAIDWSSFEAAKQRTPEFIFPYFVYGDQEGVSIGELLTEEFLRPVGAWFTVRGGTVRIVIPRIGIKGEAQITIGPDDILSRQVAPGVYAPAIHKLEHGSGQHASSVRYEIGPQKRKLTFTSADFKNTFGQGGLYTSDDAPVEIKVPGGDVGNEVAYAARAESLLQRRHRPQLSVELDVTAAKSTLAPGDYAQLTLNGLPNMATSARDWSAIDLQVLQAEHFLDKDRGAGATLELVGHGTSLNVGRIAPSAWVTSFLSTTLTVAANRATKSDAVAGLPTTDAAAFAVGDYVKLVNLDGSEVASDVEQIEGISGNDITVSGDFGGNITDTCWLIYADADTVGASQLADFAFFADETNATIGTSGGAARVYGET